LNYKLNTIMARILTIENIQIQVAKTKTPSVIITALGTVTSGGWSKPRLSPWVYIAPPADGIYDFDFEAAPPTGIATQGITAIATAQVIPNPPSWLKGVRIHASSNNLVGLLEDDKCVSFTAMTNLALRDWDGDFPWPDVLRTAAEGGGIIGNG
jgi:hypothetical protein